MAESRYNLSGVTTSRSSRAQNISSSWPSNLAGHNHIHKCKMCGSIEWHEGKRAECELNPREMCDNCIEETTDHAS